VTHRLGVVLLAGLAALAACADDAPAPPPTPATTAPAPSSAPVTTGDAAAAPTGDAEAVTTAPAAVTEPAPVSDLPPGLAVTVEYAPNLAVLRRLEVTLVNDGAVPVEITELAYRSPWVDRGPPWQGRPVVDAGRALAHVLHLGDATCPPGRGEASVVDIAVTDGAVTWRGTYPVPDPERLAALNARDCGQRAVLEVVDLVFDDAPTVEGQVLTTSLRATRRAGDDPITITQIDGSILFQLLPDGPDGALATLAPGTARASIPLEVRNTRCDAHAVSQSSLSYRFPVFVRIGDGEPTYLFLEPGPGLRAGLEALVQECLAREGSGLPVK
jgi:hypothetical protein